MPDKVVLDSSIIAAIFFKDAQIEMARKAIETSSLITVDLAAAETANVAWKKITFFDESRDTIIKALKRSIDFIYGACEVLQHKELLDDAFKIAIEDNITIYDAFFVAASDREKVTLLTTDRKLYGKIKGSRDVKLI